MDVRFKKDDLIKRIIKIGEWKQKITVSNLDGLDFIKKIDRKKEEIFIYLDPPYFKKGSDLYMNFFKENDHLNLSSRVHKLKKQWMASYDNHDFILNLYSEMNRVVYRLSQNTSNRVGDEVLIFPKQVDFKESISQLNTPILLTS